MAAPPIDFLNSVFWQFTTLAVAIVAIVGFLIYRYYLEPPIARQFTAARWSKGPVGFVQDDANQVHLITSRSALPEGIIHTPRGFFLQGRMPYIPSSPSSQQKEPENLEAIQANMRQQLTTKYPAMSATEVDATIAQHLRLREFEGGDGVKRGRGRPPKGQKQKEKAGLGAAQYEALNCALQTPTLAGFGRAVFFGYDGAPLVSNLKSLALATDDALLTKKVIIDNKQCTQTLWRYIGHADLRVMKEIIPATISRTQLSNLYKWAVAKGYEKSGKEQMKLIYIAIAAAIPIACLGIVAFLLMNGGGA